MGPVQNTCGPSLDILVLLVQLFQLAAQTRLRLFGWWSAELGQCPNCLRNAKKTLCQMACDVHNHRYHSATKGLVPYTGAHMPGTLEDGAVCPELCSNLYLSCKLVKWEDEVQYLYLDKELGVPDTERFCQDVLKMRVVNKSTGAWTAVGDGTDRERLCTPESRVDTNHCVEAGRHTALGLAAMMLCVFVVFSELATEKVSAAHDVTVAAVTRFVPSASITLFMGVVLGFIIDYGIAPAEMILADTHHVHDLVLFDENVFGFLLLPIIIFSSAFNMEKSVSIFFFLTIHRISLFAVAGTLMSIGWTGFIVYLVDNYAAGGWDSVEGGLLPQKLSWAECGMFGSLISAVDPVATLAAFASVGVDPRVYSLIYGESILNDAVAIVMFVVFQQVAIAQDDGSGGGSIWRGALLQFLWKSIGSLIIGFVWGVLVTLLFRIYGVDPPPQSDDEKADKSLSQRGSLSSADGSHADVNKAAGAKQEGLSKEEREREKEREKEEHHQRHKALADAAIFFFASLASYYVAEAMHLSGIISALVCGILCNKFAVRNMSFAARDYASYFYITLSEIADHVLMLWVGLLYCMSIPTFVSDAMGFSVLSLVLVVTSRGLSVFSLGAQL